MTSESIALHVLQIERDAIASLANKTFVTKIADAAMTINLALESGGNVIGTGVGKSGLVAMKMMSTLKSFGVPAFFLEPGNAFHGDIGCLREKDVLVVLSKSGESRELRRIVLCAKKSVAITSYEGSWLAQNASRCVVVPIVNEADEFDVAPTASTTAYMAVCDAISVCLAQLNRLTLEKFQANHPDGAIGDELKRRSGDRRTCLSTYIR
jgi:arabinose-5-phosphate isomerase